MVMHSKNVPHYKMHINPKTLLFLGFLVHILALFDHLLLQNVFSSITVQLKSIIKVKLPEIT